MVVNRGAAHRRSHRMAMRTEEDVMNRLVTFFGSLGRRDEGQDLLEYALLVALIALVAIAAATGVGTKVVAVFDAIVAAIPA